MGTGGSYGYASDYVAVWAVCASLILHTWCFFRLFPPAKRRWRLAIGNALMTLSILAVVGLLAETYLRFISTATDALGATLTCKRWQLAYAPTNSWGHRDREWTESKPPGTRRIAFFGDSFTYGWGINDPADRFTDLLQKRFDHVRPHAVEVMNVAWRGWDTRAQSQELQRLAERYEIDEVVLGYLPNDIETILPMPKGHDPTQPYQSTWLRTDNSFLLDYLYHRVYAPRRPGVINYFDWIADGFANDGLWHQHQSDLGNIIDWCREHQVTMRVVIFPFLRVSGIKYQAVEIHSKLRDFFAGSGVPTQDLLPIADLYDPRTLAVNAHDYHPNELAHRLFSDAIWNAFYAERK